MKPVKTFFNKMVTKAMQCRAFASVYKDIGIFFKKLTLILSIRVASITCVALESVSIYPPVVTSQF
jgi:hypothetical protein